MSMISNLEPGFKINNSEYLLFYLGEKNGRQSLP